MTHKGHIISAVILSLAVYGQPQDSTGADSAVQLTARTDSTAHDSAADTLSAKQTAQTDTSTQVTTQIDSTTVVSVKDTLSTVLEPVKEKTDKIDVVRHDFKFREQVGAALGMMAFIAIILTSVQNWNPD